MNPTAALTLIVALNLSGVALAQSDGMKGMDMKGMDMKGMSMDPKAQGAVHKAVGVVQKVDVAKGTVTLAHEPIKSLNWPAMTMGFIVKDKMLFDGLAVGKKVEFEFAQQGANYVITAVK